MNTKNNPFEYAAESVIDREHFEALPVHERYGYVLSCIVDEIDEAVQSGTLMRDNGSCNPLVEILRQAEAESGIAITLQMTLRQYKNRQKKCSSV